MIVAAKPVSHTLFLGPNNEGRKSYGYLIPSSLRNSFVGDRTTKSYSILSTNTGRFREMFILENTVGFLYEPYNCNGFGRKTPLL